MFRGFPKHAFPKRSYPIARIGNVGVVSDNDANNYCIAAGITDLTERQAIYFLVQELKRVNLWNRILAIYPLRGGTAESTSFNLRNPARFKITWINAPTFSFEGVTGNGTNQYGNTGINASTQLTNSNVSMSFYSRTAGISGLRCGIGAQQAGIDFSLFTQGATGFTRIIQLQAFYTGAASSQGLFLGCRSSLSDMRSYYRGALTSTISTTASNQVPNQNIFLLARNSGTPDSYTTQQCSFAHLGLAMNDSEAETFSQIVQQYQTILGIQV
jgi:hypothetical protein